MSLPSEPVEFFNRYTGKTETEVIYGEGFLRWAYESKAGRVTLATLVKRKLFSSWYGWRMSTPASRERVLPFIEKYGINRAEMAGEPEYYPTFNAFFARKLKPSARPIAEEPDTIAFPADGRHFAIPDIEASDGIFVKGIPFDLRTLLQDDALAEKFAKGSMIISRLCPVDYHRFHFPCAGVPGEAKLINGPLYSVSPIALRQRPTLLWENKRYLVRLHTEQFGEVLLLEVGATCVGTVKQTYRAGEPVQKGQEMGYFIFGGSCFITIFEPGRVKLSADLLKHSAQQHEVYARMGDVAATLRKPGQEDKEQQSEEELALASKEGAPASSPSSVQEREAIGALQEVGPSGPTAGVGSSDPTEGAAAEI
ncbi:archaetidylserine decarboxylase [Roseimicrobium sp. ORNL1]|uniref:archaetidylserine decarboxylase n=1 Tax=Roseimicrobium sp. ORNL1 TaxID=2711231 RepID=UPI0013E1AEDF|nr:archaetidylserine decarboxylase [Roseimicrobium sp. ORNL1]QIF05436.1 phosphatidylserine decarboxylase [Roseimicrobium sp. ORNL1]